MLTNRVPDEVFLHKIFRFLGVKTIVSSLYFVSKHFNALSTQLIFWRSLCEEDFRNNHDLKLVCTQVWGCVDDKIDVELFLNKFYEDDPVKMKHKFIYFYMENVLTNKSLGFEYIKCELFVYSNDNKTVKALDEGHPENPVASQFHDQWHGEIYGIEAHLTQAVPDMDGKSEYYISMKFPQNDEDCGLDFVLCRKSRMYIVSERGMSSWGICVDSAEITKAPFDKVLDMSVDEKSRYNYYQNEEKQAKFDWKKDIFTMVIKSCRKEDLDEKDDPAKFCQLSFLWDGVDMGVAFKKVPLFADSHGTNPYVGNLVPSVYFSYSDMKAQFLYWMKK